MKTETFAPQMLKNNQTLLRLIRFTYEYEQGVSLEQFKVHFAESPVIACGVQAQMTNHFSYPKF